MLVYHIQFITGTNAQTGHLAERIRILHEPVPERHDLAFGWDVSASREMNEAGVRALFREHGIGYPDTLPLVHGDYSISAPSWNAEFWDWDSRPDEHLPVWMQPRWWLFANWHLFSGDLYGENQSLREWLAQFLTVEDVAEQFGVTPRRVRALAKNRHERFGIGWQVPGTNQWLFRPEELEALQPDERYQRK